MRGSDISIRSVRVLGAAARLRGLNWSMGGQDGGQSIALERGSLFCFSDTLVATGATTSFVRPPRRGEAIFLANCAAVSVDGTLADAMAGLRYFSDAQGRPRELLEPTLAERLGGIRFWPQHGVLVGDRVYLFYLGIHHFDQTNSWGFRECGVGLAEVDPATGACTRLMWNGEWRMWPELPPNCHCGVQVLREGETLYIFASRRGVPDYEAFVARVDGARMGDPAAYEFFSRDGWSRRFVDARPIAQCGSEYSVAFNRYLGLYVMLYAMPYGKKLMMRTAETPWGPYGEAVLVGGLPHEAHVDSVCLSFQHPQFDVDDGRTIVVSYSQPHFVQNTLVEISFG